MSTGIKVLIGVAILFAVAVPLAIIAAISVPIYIEYVKGSRSNDAQVTIGTVFNAVKMYRQDRGADPGSVEELEQLGYLTVDELTKKQWKFTLIGNPVQAIEAVSTAEMKGGAGHQVKYDFQTGRFTGYGLATEESGQ